ncbi:uncharacterized protein METZ01_LOCUS90179 [marine metagenome]|uniref:Uncharacterized protein n=1 Tax=marine metagenome TaxID=408172 RepID=A0A381VAD7_9ZZZZ
MFSNIASLVDQQIQWLYIVVNIIYQQYTEFMP